MTTTSLSTIAIVVSALSLLVSLCSFLWTLYKDSVYRAMVKVTVSIQNMPQLRGEHPVMDVINQGPGTVTLDYIMHESRPFYQRWRERKTRRNITFTKPPIGETLKPGDTFRHILSDQLLIFSEKLYFVGVCDTNRRVYFASTRQTKNVIKDLRNSPKWKAAYDQHQSTRRNKLDAAQR